MYFDLQKIPMEQTNLQKTPMEQTNLQKTPMEQTNLQKTPMEQTNLKKNPMEQTSDEHVSTKKLSTSVSELECKNVCILCSCIPTQW